MPNDHEPDGNRRDFLAKCGRFALITPPAVTFLLSTSMSSKAIAASGGHPSHGSLGDALSHLPGKHGDHGPHGKPGGNGKPGSSGRAKPQGPARH